MELYPLKTCGFLYFGSCVKSKEKKIVFDWDAGIISASSSVDKKCSNKDHQSKDYQVIVGSMALFWKLPTLTSAPLMQGEDISVPSMFLCGKAKARS